MEIYGYIFLSCGNERKTKISYSLVFQKGKIYKYLWDVFLMLWTPLDLGRDTLQQQRILSRKVPCGIQEMGNGCTYGMIDGSQTQILLKWLARVAFTLDWRLLDMERKDQDATKVKNIFLPHEAKVILGIPINPRLLDDSLSWAWTSNDRFTMKSACRMGQKCLKEGNYQTERGGSSNNLGMKAIWKLIWYLNCPKKIKHYMWRSYKNILPIKLCLKSRGIRQEDSCDLCGLSESSGHILQGCSLAVVVWGGTKIKLPFLLEPPRELLNIVWEVKENPLGIDWNFFTIMAWSLWNNMNSFRHGGQSRRHDVIVRELAEYVREVRQVKCSSQPPVLTSLHGLPLDKGAIKTMSMEQCLKKQGFVESGL